VTKKEVFKRYLLFIACLFFMGIGVALTKHGELGVSPISSVANVVSIKFTCLSFGTWLTISNCVLLLGQILLLRKKFKLMQLLQIPLSFLFGYFTDFGLWIADKIPNDTYLAQILLVFSGIIVLGFGITLGVIADVILNSGEAFVKALSDVTKKDFGNLKIAFDVSWVLLSVVLSLIFFEGKLYGTREGTILSALLVGVAVKLFRKVLQHFIQRQHYIQTVFRLIILVSAICQGVTVDVCIFDPSSGNAAQIFIIFLFHAAASHVVIIDAAQELGCKITKRISSLRFFRNRGRACNRIRS